MKCFYSLSLLLLASVVDSLKKPVISTTLGAVEGIEDRSTSGKRIYAFLGVPYAKPPVEEFRFEEPQPLEGWQGIWPATEPSAVCLQHMLNYDIPDLIVGEEDCLHLNIYTPTLSNSSRLPVLVFIHGGAFMYGTGNIFTPHFMLDRADLVYVSINYRLGPFGFLSTEDQIVPGNNGLKDQVMALKWIQQHIFHFGGNKHEVTVAGLSAGGASVHLHYMSPLSKGLFKKGISMSGTAYCPWVLTEQSSQKAKMLALSVGCTTSDSKEMVQCLKKRPGRKILSKLKSLFWPWLTIPISPFGIVVESNSDKSFLSEHPYKLVSEGKISDLPWLTSVTSDEGLYPSAAFTDREALLKELDKNWYIIAPHLLEYNYTILPENLDNISDKIKKFYFGKENISIKTRNQLVKMVGDRLFVTDVVKASQHQAAASQSPVYFYEFGYQGKFSISVFISKFNSTMGVSHGDDLIYILNRPVLSPLDTEEDKAMMLKITNIWISFILTGKPSPGDNINWNPISKNFNTKNIPYLLIKSSENIMLKYSTDLGNQQFWNSLDFHELENKLNINQLKDEL